MEVGRGGCAQFGTLEYKESNKAEKQAASDIRYVDIISLSNYF